MKVWDITYKDLLRSFRSLFAIGMMFAAPLLITGLIYAAFGGLNSGETQLPTLKVGIVNLDQPISGQPLLGSQLVEMLKDKSVSAWLKASDVPDEAKARAAVDAQEMGVAVIIPANFSRAVFSGTESANLLMIQDPTLTISPVVVKNMLGSYLDGIAGGRIGANLLVERQQAHGLTPQADRITAVINQFSPWFIRFQQTLYHDPQSALVLQPPAAKEENGSNSLSRMVGLIMAGQMIFFSFYTGAYSMMSILTEQEEGTLARLFTTPNGRTKILVGKFLAVILSVIVQALVLIFASSLAFKINWGEPLPFILALLGQVIASTGFGVFLIALVKNSRQAGPVLGGGLTVFGMLGGLFTVAMQMPAVFNLLSRFTPQGWALENWKIALSGGPVSSMLLPLAILLAVGILLFAAGARLFARRFA